MEAISENEINNEIEDIRKSSKPSKHKLQINYPYNSLEDKGFELLLYSITSSRKLKVKDIDYDKCGLCASSGDKGRDLVLFKNNKLVAVIQCKKHINNLEKADIAKEVIKFVLHCIQDKSDNINYSNFTYIFAVSTGLNGEATNLVEQFKKIINEKDFEKWTNDIIDSYKRIKVSYAEVYDDLCKILSQIKVDSLLPIDITKMVNMDPQIITTFFDVDKVISIKDFEDIVLGRNLDVGHFLDTYKNSVINNFSRVNFFGLSVNKKPKEKQLYSLFINPSFALKGSSVSDFTFKDDFFEINNSYSTNYFYTIDDKSVYKKALEILNKINSDDLSSYTIDTLELLNSTKKKGIDEKIPFKSLFNNSKNMVILGKPGAGKSSLVKYSISKLLDKDYSIFSNNKIYNRIPFRIELHKYNKTKFELKIGLIEYISMLLSHEFQLTFISKNSIEELLKKYETVFFFDGLDEIMDIQERISVRNDIENILTNNPKILGIVTSRYESYNEVNFKDKDFDVYEVKDFDDEQIKLYINKWYDLEEEDEKIKNKEIDHFIIELEKIEDELKRNPLLLTLILILYRNEQELPTSKLDVYENCTNTLVETRDKKEKQLGIKLSVSNIIGTFAALAYWQFYNIDISRDIKITYELALKQIKNFLIQKGEYKQENEAEAQTAAVEFLEFAKIRSIYVENNFTHKTFLEYFIAYYIFANYNSKGDFKKRDEIITEHIGKSSWKVVLELLVMKIDKEQLDFEVIDNLISKQLDHNKAQALDFFLQILKYLRNVSPDMIYTLLNQGISICLNATNTTNNIFQSINDHLLHLSMIDKFQVIFEKILLKICDELKTEKDLYNFTLFILENRINLEKFLDNMDSEKYKNMIDKDQYLFVLLNYPLITDHISYSRFLDMFLSKYGAKAIIRTYNSRYGRALFNGNPKFNWIITPIFNNGKNDFETFRNMIDVLSDKKINYEDIKKSIDNYNGSISMPYEILDKYYTQNKKIRQERLLKVIFRKFFDTNMDNETDNEKFNFGSYNKKSRRFPIPK